MKMKKFWKWKNQTETNPERTLFLNGTIAEESWFDDDITPQLFKEDLLAGEGDITVWINSPGGDCVAAAQIYNMLMDYKGNVTVKIDGIAASAASVIAMAGTSVLMSPVSMLMIHNPMTVAMGDAAEMEKAIEMLASVKESIINAYEIKSGLSRAKISHLMDDETWMDANKAIELGFADAMLSRPTFAPDEEEDDEDEDYYEKTEDVSVEPDEDEEESEEDIDSESDEDEDTESEEEKEKEKKNKKSASSMLFSRKSVDSSLMQKINKHNKPVRKKANTKNQSAEVPVSDIMSRLNTIKKFI